MAESPTQVFYTVYAKIPDQEDPGPYVEWLEKKHMHDVIRLGRALKAELTLHDANPDKVSVEGRYLFSSKQDLKRYVREFAPDLRKEAIERFPGNTYTRYTSFLKAVLHPQADMDKASTYRSLLQQIERSLTPELPFLSRVSSAVALMKSELEYASWVGFYEAIGQELWVGPYQGPLACAHIPFGKGVCGHVAQTGETALVEDVEKFPGHIACDSLSRSEVVVPVVKNGELKGVLDVDSHLVAAFDEVDVHYLKKICDCIVGG